MTKNVSDILKSTYRLPDEIHMTIMSILSEKYDCSNLEKIEPLYALLVELYNRID